MSAVPMFFLGKTGSDDDVVTTQPWSLRYNGCSSNTFLENDLFWAKNSLVDYGLSVQESRLIW